MAQRGQAKRRPRHSSSTERDMKEKYRARWDSNTKHGSGACWLTDADTICVYAREAVVGSLQETVNRIAQMSRP